MIRTTLFVSLILAWMNVHADEEPKSSIELGHIAQACHIAHHSNDENKVKCLNNVRSTLKSNINTAYKNLGPRDLTHLLNTKALELEILRNNCGVLPASQVVKVDCEIQADLSLIQYIGDRYESN